MFTLQKQVGYFNQRVITLVEDKLERQWLQEVNFGIEDYLHKATLEAAAQFSLQPQYTDNHQNICNAITNL